MKEDLMKAILADAKDKSGKFAVAACVQHAIAHALAPMSIEQLQTLTSTLGEIFPSAKFNEDAVNFSLEDAPLPDDVMFVAICKGAESDNVDLETGHLTAALEACLDELSLHQLRKITAALKIEQNYKDLLLKAA